jgi:hypothetical protein
VVVGEKGSASHSEPPPNTIERVFGSSAFLKLLREKRGRNTLKRSVSIALFSALGWGFLGGATPLAQDDKSVTQDMKDAGNSTKDATKKAAKNTKKGTKKAAKATKDTTEKGVNKAAEGTEKAAGKVKEKTTPP